MKDLQDIVHELKARRVALWKMEQPIDTGTAAGRKFLIMLRVSAKSETTLRHERQLEDIPAAKARGMYRRRKPSIDPAIVQRRREQDNLGPGAIAMPLGIGRARVFWLLDKVGT
jgi:DNA invertase Pin-like site-specific DNA recombinase